MKKYRYVKAAVLCLCIATVSLFVFFAANETEARIINTMSWKKVYVPYSETQESNYLTEDGNTVILEDWIVNSSIEERVSKLITITSSKEVSGTFTCSSDSKYLDASLDKYELTVGEKESEVELLLKLTYEAFRLKEDTLVEINVTWIPDDDELNELKATFNILLRPEDTPISEEDAVGLTSNYLDRNGHTVVLEDWKMDSLAYRTKDILFSLDTGEISGILECESDSEFIKAELDTTEIKVTNVGYIARLTLTPSESALNITEETTVTVRINWKEKPKIDSDGNELNTDSSPIMWVDIKVKLIPNSNQIEVITSNDLEDGSQDNFNGIDGEEADILSSDSDSFVWTESLVIDVSAVNGAQHIYITYNGGNFPEGTIYSADNNEYLVNEYIYVAVFDNTPQEVCIDFSGTETVAPEKFYITAKAENAGVTYVDALEIFPRYEVNETEIFDDESVPEKIASNNESVIYMTAPKSADTLKLYYNGGKFPAGTGYFVDNQDPVTLGDDAVISIPVFSREKLTVTFDFTRVDMTEVTDISISAEAYNCGVLFATDSFSCDVYEETVDALFNVETCPETFAKEEYLTLELTAPLNSETMEFRYNGGPFPGGVRYSINSDEFITLADDVTIKCSVTPGEKIKFTIDFSQVDVEVVKIPDTDNTGVIISASAYIGNRKIEEGSVATSPTRKPLTADYKSSEMIINKSGSISVPITGADEKTEIIVERLVIKGGVTERVTADDLFGIDISITEDENIEKLIISNSEQKAAAGSYRITLLRKHNEEELRRIEIPLFIYY